MNRFVRIVLAWALVIAMPVQGMAASAMLFCGPSHERMMHGPAPGTVVQMQGHANHPAHGDGVIEHGHHGHVDAGEPCNACDSPGPAASAGPDDDPAQALMPHHGELSCSVCAACCSMLVLPAQFAPPPVLGPVHPADLSPVSPVDSHQPDRLDRPPRTLLA